jgi:hypothetical protein
VLAETVAARVDADRRFLRFIDGVRMSEQVAIVDGTRPP